MSERNFTQLKKDMNMKDFNSFCVTVMKFSGEYGSKFSQKCISNHFRITRSCFRKIREYSTITGIISKEMAWKIAMNSVTNQKTHSANFGRASIDYHYKLMRKKR